MLDNIKSSYFSKIIFSFIDEKIKLKILKYNKKMQNNMGIKLIHYKFFSKKYIINEGNGKIKIYDGFLDSLIFEGEYLNGKGKIYNNSGDLQFEGEFLKGKRFGKGKEYFNEKLIFEGEYINDKTWKGKVYDENGNVIYELDNTGKNIIRHYRKGKLTFEGEHLKGKGKEYDDYGKLIYDGEYLNGLRNGKGREYYRNGDLKCEGEYFYGRRWNCKLYDKNNNIISEIKNGKGFIKENNNMNELKFEGKYLNGLKNGKGKEFLYNQLDFEGEYLNGLKNGKGKKYNSDGNLLFEGEYLYGKRIKGKDYYLNGKLEFEGDYLFGKKWNGKGYDENGNIIYELNNGNGKVRESFLGGEFTFEGEYLNGKKNGKGKEFIFTYLIYEGEFLNGQKSGKGKEYISNNELIYEGEFLNGKRNGKGKEYNDGRLVFQGEYLNGKRWNGKLNEYNEKYGKEIEVEYINGEEQSGK